MISTRPELPIAVTELLGKLRRQIRRYVWREGLAQTIAWLGIAFWATLAIDWFFEPSSRVRAAMLAAGIGGVLWIVVQRIVRRMMTPLRDSAMALLLERCFPQFQESLLTAVELTARGADPAECSPAMLHETCRLAAEPAPRIDVRRVFNPAPLRQMAIAASLLLVSVGLYAVALPEMLTVWVQRNLLLSEEVFWPRNTRLEVDGFANGALKVARGTDLEVVAKADLRWPVAPQTVQVRYRTQAGAHDRRTMSRDGTADRTKDQYQYYSYTFRSLLAPVEFDVVGGDDAVRGLRIDVVDNPAVVKMELDCRYPAYMARSPRTLPVSAAVMPIPNGSEVVVRASTNKDLVRVEVQSPLDEPAKSAVAADPPPLSADRRGFQFPVGRLTVDKTLLFTLFDTDGIKSREPIRLTLARLDDKPPELTVQLRGIGTAITPRAMLPAAGKVTDDHGIARVWFEYLIDQDKPAERTILTPKENPTELAIKHVLDVRDLNLNPGRKLTVMVKASDHCNLSERPNVGSGQRWVLDVVTPEQLRVMLDARELSLRQRFAAIIQEVSENRDSLARIQFVPDRAGDGGKLEPGEKADQGTVSAQQLADQRRSRVQRASQYSLKNAGETLGVAEAFGDIREELINNRIDTEELKIRLKTGIADPLRQIAQEMFPELDRRLDQLLKTIDDPQAGPEDRTRAIQHVDAILAVMRQVLNRMVELEDFGEMIERLRSIIQEQEKLQELIQKRHKQRLRDLLEK